LEYTIQGDIKVLLSDYSNGQPVLFLPKAYMSHIKVDTKPVVSQGGEQNISMLGWSDKQNDTFLLQSSLFSMKFLELAVGSQLLKENTRIAETETIQVINSDVVNLSYMPVPNLKIHAFLLNNTGSFLNEQLDIIAVNGQEIQFSKNISGWVLIKYLTEQNVEVLNIGKFANKGFYQLLGEVDIYNKETAELEILKFEFFKVAIHNHFNLKMISNNNLNQLFTIHCQAMGEEKFNKAIMRLIKREEG